MVDQVRVTVAPGRHVTVKHPSGLAGLPPVTLYAGATLLADPVRAEELYRNGQVLHPISGLAVPPQPERAPPPLVQVSGSYEDAAARAEAAKQPRPIPPGDDWWSKNPTVIATPRNLSDTSGTT